MGCLRLQVLDCRLEAALEGASSGGGSSARLAGGIGDERMGLEVGEVVEVLEGVVDVVRELVLGEPVLYDPLLGGGSR